MRILSSVTTFNRLAYTKRSLESLGDTGWLTVVDNASDDGTREWLREAPVDQVIFNDRNLFPGPATNIGWHESLKCFEAELLHRSDNDVVYEPGWLSHVRECFTAMPGLGQLGLLNMHEDYPDGQPLDVYEEAGVKVNRHWPTVGGNSVIRRELWDRGIRWKAGPWEPGGNDEDATMSRDIQRYGYFVANVIPTIATNISFHRYDDYPEYYNRTAELRGLVAKMSV